MKYTVPALILSVLIPAPALADGDPAKGKRVFNKCAICHAVGPDAKAKVGVELNGVVGRPIASIEGFDYSPALSASNITWDAKQLDAYLTAPGKLVPGTRMVIAVPDAARRQALIEYLSAP